MNKYEFILAIFTISRYILNNLSLVIIITEGKKNFIIEYRGKKLKWYVYGPVGKNPIGF